MESRRGYFRGSIVLFGQKLCEGRIHPESTSAMKKFQPQNGYLGYRLGMKSYPVI